MRARLVGPIAVTLVATLTSCLATDPTPLPVPSSAPSIPAPSRSGASPSASDSVPSSTRPTATPARATPARATELRPDAFAQVVSGGLRVRSEPFVGGASRRLEPLLWKGEAVFVIDGPVAGSGYEWYLVQPMSEVDVQIHPDPPGAGWVAAASVNGERWLAPLDPGCLDSPFGWLQFELLALPADLSGLACFGDRSFDFTAWVRLEPGDHCDGPSGPWTVDPGWLGPCVEAEYRLANGDPAATDDMPSLEVRIAPSVDVDVLNKIAPRDWLLVDVVAQYAHPAAKSCTASPTGGDGEGPPRPEVVVLACRAQFVVTTMYIHRDT